MMWCEEDSFRLIRPGLLWSAWLNITLQTACGQLDPLSLSLTTQTWSKHINTLLQAAGTLCFPYASVKCAISVSSGPVSWTRIKWRCRQIYTGFNRKEGIILRHDCVHEVSPFIFIISKGSGCSTEEEGGKKAGDTPTKEEEKLKGASEERKDKENICEETSPASSGLSRRWPVSFNSPPPPARNRDWLKRRIFCSSDILQLSVSQWDYRCYGYGRCDLASESSASHFDWPQKNVTSGCN